MHGCEGGSGSEAAGCGEDVAMSRCMSSTEAEAEEAVPRHRGVSENRGS